MARQIPECALALIRTFEGLRLTAYRCPAGVWTIGYGHTRTAREGMTITQDKAEYLLLDDARAAGAVIDAAVKVPLTKNEFGALVSFVFNVGEGNFRRSTLLKQLNMGWHDQIPAQLMRWNKAGGVVLGGLSRRRTAEANVWRTKAEG